MFEHFIVDFSHLISGFWPSVLKFNEPYHMSVVSAPVLISSPRSPFVCSNISNLALSFEPFKFRLVRNMSGF